MFENNKKILFIITVGIAFVLLIVFYMLLISAKQPPSLPAFTPTPTSVQDKVKPKISTPPFIKSDINQKPSAAITYDFSALSPTLPTSSYSFLVKSYEVTQKTIDRIITNNQLNPSYEQVTNGDDTHTLYWYNTDRTRTLTLLFEKGALTFTSSRALAKGESTGETITENTTKEEIIRIADTYIQKNLFLPPDLKTSTEKVLFLNKYSENGNVEETFENTTIFEVSFEQFLEGRKVYRQLGTTSRATIQLNRLKQITKFTFQYPTTERYRREQLLSYQDIQQQIKNTQGKIVRIGDNLGYLPELPPITNVIFDNIELAYFDDDTSGFIQPVFILTGTALLQDQSRETVMIMVPGIK